MRPDGGTSFGSRQDLPGPPCVRGKDSQAWIPAGAALACLFFALGLCGCATYSPKPLTADAVSRTLAPPDADELRIAAEQLKHPILKPIALDLHQGLSPKAAGVLAVLLNPSLRTLRDQRGIADAQLLQAGLLPNPELSYSFESPVGGDTAGTVNGFGLELTWDVASLISRSAKKGEARSRRAAVELDIAWAEWQTAEAAKSAVYRLAYLRAQVALATEAAKHLNQNRLEVAKAVSRGAKTSRDLAAAQAASRSAEETRLDLQKQTEQRRLELNRLLGLPPTVPVRLREGIELPSRFDPHDASALLDELEARRLDLVALRRGYDSQEAAVRAAALEQFPNVSIGPTFARDTDNLRTAGFGLTIELPIFDRNQGRIAIEQATRQGLFDEYVNRVFEARSNTGMIVSRIRFLNEQVAASEAAESELQRLVEEYGAALTDGRTDALTYFGAWKHLADNRMNQLVLRGQLSEAVVALELATGLYEIPQSSEPPARSLPLHEEGAR